MPSHAPCSRSGPSGCSAPGRWTAWPSLVASGTSSSSTASRTGTGSPARRSSAVWAATPSSYRPRGSTGRSPARPPRWRTSGPRCSTGSLRPVLDRFKQFWQGVMLAPFINLFIRLGISPDAVTLVGTLGVSFGAIFFFAQGWVWQGVVFITAFVFSDLIDGAMARKMGRKDDFGAFLDSTLDRVADAALFGGMACYFAWHAESRLYLVLSLVILAMGAVTSYARAKA